jgi:hypothetical protein
MTKIAILLTTYNNGFSPSGENRKDIYEDVINWWADNTPFSIFVTDSSNTMFSNVIENKVKTCHFKQPPNITNKSILESISVYKCFEKYKTELLQYDFIFKVTGKYKFANFNTIINNIPDILTFDFIRQNTHSREKEHKQIGWGKNFWVSTEIIGFKPEFLLKNFYKLTNYNIEHSTYDYLYKSKKYYHIYTMPTVINIAKWHKQHNEHWVEFFKYKPFNSAYLNQNKFKT